MLKYNFKILLALFLILVLGALFISWKHPIVLKWMTGTARSLGHPISAEVYTNGHLNEDIKVFAAKSSWLEEQETSSLVIYFPHLNKDKIRRVIYVHLMENYVARPNSNKMDYDIVFGRLLQSEGGNKSLVSFNDYVKGFRFDPQLLQKDGQIKFLIPPVLKDFNCDSVRIEVKNYF